MFRRTILLASLTIVAVVSACGSTATTISANNFGVKVHFIGNGTCPTTANSSDSNPQPYSPSPPNTNGSPVGQPVDEMPHDHISPPATVTYEHDPPTSGCHYNLGYGTAPIQTGVYDKPIQPEYWVHNLEHGYVVVLYNCPAGCATDVKALSDWYKTVPPDPKGVGYQKVLVMPETTMAPKFAVVSWDWYDPMPTKLDIGEVQKFFNNHVDESPEEAGGTGVTP